MALDITVFWTFLLFAGVNGELVPTQVYHFPLTEAGHAACEQVRQAHLQSAVSPRCYRVAVMRNEAKP